MVGWHANVCYHPVMVELFNVSNATMCGTLTLKSASQNGHCNVAKFHHVWWTLKLRLKSSLEKWFHSDGKTALRLAEEASKADVAAYLRSIHAPSKSGWDY